MITGIILDILVTQLLLMGMAFGIGFYIAKRKYKND